MQKNITLKLDEQLLNRVKHIAIDQQESVSTWVANLIKQAIADKDELEQSKRRALALLEEGLHLGGKPLSREEIYDR